ncbi:hypothetical protein BOTBODRAFT_32019 [Botryobasidium botryosum FD-172 SS1]|uniref:Uncharacterized protein n=1 Tax=Botryobasidium botryosum (strain FD-172 SS1) TaxID=930990 RepID=A0A067MGV3_BOTB1|nr:hypothetical protein BOTBODRAFT_32019 [Botryobasidium botryosum FD-172 SS1]
MTQFLSFRLLGFGFVATRNARQVLVLVYQRHLACPFLQVDRPGANISLAQLPQGWTLAKAIQARRLSAMH